MWCRAEGDGSELGTPLGAAEFGRLRPAPLAHNLPHGRLRQRRSGRGPGAGARTASQQQRQEGGVQRAHMGALGGEQVVQVEKGSVGASKQGGPRQRGRKRRQARGGRRRERAHDAPLLQREAHADQHWGAQEGGALRVLGGACSRRLMLAERMRLSHVGVWARFSLWATLHAQGPPPDPRT